MRNMLLVAQGETVSHCHYTGKLPADIDCIVNLWRLGSAAGRSTVRAIAALACSNLLDASG